MENLRLLLKEKKISHEVFLKYQEINEIYPIKLSEHIKNTISDTKSQYIARQFLPNPKELDDYDGTGAYFPDEQHLTNLVVKKYPNRCIIYTTSHCYANCRHCSRKAEWKSEIVFSKLDFDKSIEYIKSSSFIEEVILTGGDAFYNSDENIQYMLEELSNIKHIKVIRIGTRSFTAFPKRITHNLCKIIESYQNIVIMTQFNHPDEFGEDTIKALRMIQKTGVPVFNQAVLLKGINDRYSTMKNLLLTCASNRVIPYYLFHCFKVKGVQCYRTSVEIGEEIINNLVGNIGGWWIPRYILIPHKTGVKVPVCPNGIISRDNGSLTVKDYQDRLIEYM